MYDPNDVLFLDIGNTRTNWRYRLDYGDILNLSLLESPETFWQLMPQTSVVVAVSVGGPAVRALLRDSLRYREWIDVDQVEPAVFATDYEARQLGIDRWLASLAVGRKSDTGGQQVVVDAGTAVTIDLVSEGRHSGGWILPGFSMWHRALLGQTEIPVWQVTEPVRRLGLTTRDAIASGWLAAVSGAVKQLPGNDSDGSIWLTGGDRERLMPAFSGARMETNLVLDGLDFWLRAKGVVK